MSALTDRGDVVSIDRLELPEGSGLFGNKQTFDEDMRRHDELEVAVPNAVADVEHALAVFDTRHVTGVENSVKFTGWHTRAPTRQTAEHGLCAVSAPLTEDNICEQQSTVVHPTEFAMLKVADNRLIPLFVIPRWPSFPSAEREPTGVFPSARGYHSDWKR